MKTRQIVGFIFVTLILIVMQVCVSAQNLQKLDEDNGFRIFQIGESYEKYSDSLNLVAQNSDGTISYNYIGKDLPLRTIDSVYFYDIRLLFDSNKTIKYISFYIFISNNSRNFEKRTNRTFESLKKFFIARYGADYKETKIEGNPKLEWNALKVQFVLKMIIDVNNKWRRIDVCFSKKGED